MKHITAVAATILLALLVQLARTEPGVAIATSSTGGIERPATYRLVDSAPSIEILLQRVLDAHSNQIELALTAADVERIIKAGKVSAVLTIESGHAIADDGRPGGGRFLHRNGSVDAALHALDGLVDRGLRLQAGRACVSGRQPGRAGLPRHAVGEDRRPLFEVV